MQTKSLYEPLGGYDAIAAVTDDLLARLLNDPQLGVFWKGYSENSLRKGPPTGGQLAVRGSKPWEKSLTL